MVDVLDRLENIISQLPVNQPTEPATLKVLVENPPIERPEVLTSPPEATPVVSTSAVNAVAPAPPPPLPPMPARSPAGNLLSPPSTGTAGAVQIVRPMDANGTVIEPKTEISRPKTMLEELQGRIKDRAARNGSGAAPFLETAC